MFYFDIIIYSSSYEGNVRKQICCWYFFTSLFSSFLDIRISFLISPWCLPCTSSWQGVEGSNLTERGVLRGKDQKADVISVSLSFLFFPLLWVFITPFAFCSKNMCVGIGSNIWWKIYFIFLSISMIEFISGLIDKIAQNNVI